MKKYLLLGSVMVLLALVSGCQKEQRTVTLGLSLEQDAKLVIDENNYPCWSTGDLVHVNGQHDLEVSDISSNGRSAQITGVTESQDGYCVLYPSSLVRSGTTISSGEVSVKMPGSQDYAVDGNGRQKVTLPMGGVSNSTNMTLHNLGSILRVNVTNGLGHSVTLSYIMVTANNANLSGNCTATITGNETDKIVSSNTGGGMGVNLLIPSSAAAATLAAGGNKTFSIVLPTFSNGSQITVRVGTTEGGYRDFQTKSTDITLASNQIVNFNDTLTSYTGYEDATLKDGGDIKTAIQNAGSNITAVSFVCGATDVTSGTELQSSGSLTKIYGNVVFDEDEGTYTYVISTPASVMKATDCSNMFQGLSSLTSITFGTGFNTEEVGSMNNMFDGCESLESLNLSSFNTEGVGNMSNMFSGCESLESLNLSSFNTGEVGNMGSMFNGCESLESLNLSSFNTGSVNNMSYMFKGCSGLTSLDLSSFITGWVSDMSSMFNGCSGLTSLDLSSFNTENVLNMSYMFSGCTHISELNLSIFNISSVDNTDNMCSDLATETEADDNGYNCTITCTNDVWTALTTDESIGLPSEDWVHFNWVTPSK